MITSHNKEKRAAADPTVSPYLRFDTKSKLPVYRPGGFGSPDSLVLYIPGGIALSGVFALQVSPVSGDKRRAPGHTGKKEEEKMSKLFFGFALADSMFEGCRDIHRSPLSPDTAAYALEHRMRELVVCCNPSHTATIEALSLRFPHIAEHVVIPPTPPRVALTPGDAIMVMGVRGLPRLTDRHEYTPEEIGGATFSFSLYEVVGE